VVEGRLPLPVFPAFTGELTTKGCEINIMVTVTPYSANRLTVEVRRPRISYLMGNHTIAERMFRYEPSVLLYAPLHTAIWGAPDGPAYLSFDRPSDQFSSFAHPGVATIGVELDRKMAALVDHLGTEIPDALLTT
jgi:hypothetical protein